MTEHTLYPPCPLITELREWYEVQGIIACREAADEIERLRNQVVALGGIAINSIPRDSLRPVELRRLLARKPA